MEILNKTEEMKIVVPGIKKRSKLEIPFWRKYTLTLEEAAAYSGIGVNRLRSITEEDGCPFVLWIGSRRVVKRVPFEKYIDTAFSM